MKKITISVLCIVMIGFVAKIATAKSSDFKSKNFTSVYTDLNKACRTKGGGDGGDPFFECRGVGGYKIESGSSAAAAFYTLVMPGGGSKRIALQDFDYNHAKYKAEWRLSDGKPFALIMRFYQYSEKKNEYSQFGKKTGEYLRVLGLKDFDNIDFVVDASERNANQKARDLADNGFVQAYNGYDENEVNGLNANFIFLRFGNEEGYIQTEKIDSSVWGRYGEGKMAPLLNTYRLIRRTKTTIVLKSTKSGSITTLNLSDKKVYLNGKAVGKITRYRK